MTTLSAVATDLRTIAKELDEFECPPPSEFGFTGFGVLHAAGWPIGASKTAVMNAIGYGESGGFLDAVGDYWQVLKTYEVRLGDTLSSIAAWLKLDGWQELYEANLDVVGPNPNVIEAGMVLRNPGLASNADVWLQSLGLYQIRALREPDKYPSGPYRTASALRDPVFQAKAAWAISSRGEDFTPWSIFKNDSYKKYLNQDYPLLVGHERAGLWPQSN